MPDLSNDAQWYPVFEGSTSVNGRPTRENKIPPIPLTIPFVNRYFRCYVQTSNLKWYYGGRVILYIGSINTPAPIYATNRKLILKKWTLLDFPLIEGANSSQFYLVYEPPWWFADVNLAIYQYQELNIFDDDP